MDLEEEKFALTFIANMSVTGQYDIDGRILILPVQGHGDSTIKCGKRDVLKEYFRRNELRNSSKLYLCKNFIIFSWYLLSLFYQYFKAFTSSFCVYTSRRYKL